MAKRFKKKKVHKQRASTFHGWGRGASHHKGAGNRGGRGRAGSGKKSDGKKPSFWKEVQGRHGFTSKGRMNHIAINIEQVEARLAEFEKMGFASKKGSAYEVDLTKSTFNKLLATGTPKTAMTITVDFASKGATAKVEAAGGKLTVLKTIKKKVKKKAAAPKKKGDKEEPAAESE